MNDMQNSALNNKFKMTKRRLKVLNNKYIIAYNIKIDTGTKVF
jgi:hypothetical protein